MATGSCFCGAVRFEVTGKLTGVTYCHCSKCRRWHGHVGAFTAADRPGFTLHESRGLRWHSVSATVRRGFCGECGSTMFFDDSTDPKIAITAGVFDAPTGLREKAHIFVGSKGDYYEIASELKEYEAGP